MGDAEKSAAPAPTPTLPSAGAAKGSEAATFPSALPSEAPVAASAPINWPFWSYLLPAAVLLLLTLIALARLFVLKSRATVLVEPEWLTALARAQRRMGFKHGTALLTSDELPSPISWGVVRPVILLNSEAAKSHEEAEAIITHELAHVARLDWAKLMVSRIAVALFWFNPLVWVLAREAHQLREEAADDTVLAADIEDTDYARLLVGVARHQCRGLLLGAHGVAPGRNSLTRRIKRVLDTATARAPGGWRWASAVGFFAAGMAVPVAALNLVAPSAAASAINAADAPSEGSDYAADETALADVGHLPATVAQSASAAAAAASGTMSVAVHPHPQPWQQGERDMDPNPDVEVDVDVDVDLDDNRKRSRSRSGLDETVDAAIAAKIHGVTPDYIAAMRAASPQLANADMDDLVGFKIHGVTPAFIRSLEGAGYRNLSKKQLTSAAIHRISPEFLRSLAAAGVRPSFDEAVKMRIFRVTPQYIADLRRAGYGHLSVKQMVKMRIHGVDVNDLKKTASDP